MSAPDHKQLAESWLTVQRHWKAFHAVCRLVESSPKEGLSLILMLLELADSEELLRDIGCGPLEDLLHHNASAVIDAVERLAKDNGRMRTALSHVWFSQGNATLNQRLEALGCRIVPVKRADDP